MADISFVGNYEILNKVKINVFKTDTDSKYIEYSEDGTNILEQSFDKNGLYVFSPKNRFEIYTLNKYTLRLQIDITNYNPPQKLTSLYSMFACARPESNTIEDGFEGVIGLDKLDTSNVKQFNYAFQYLCQKSLDLSSFDTSNALQMSYMFNGAKLQKLDLSSFNTDKLQYASRMFYSANIDELIFPNLNLSSVSRASNVQSMFGGSFKKLDLSNAKWNSNLNGILDGIPGLQSLKLSSSFTENGYLDFSTLTEWADDTVRWSLVENSYDFKANGSSATLKLSAATKAALTAADKQIMANKGYTIA